MKFQEISEVPAEFHEISCSDTFWRDAPAPREALRSDEAFHEISLNLTEMKRRLLIARAETPDPVEEHLVQ